MNPNHTPKAVGRDYPSGRLAAALTTAFHHQDPDVRASARARAEAWTRVVEGMGDGTLTIGSRTPVRGLPAWVTPEVAHGGFATGAAAAGGPLRPHEEELAARHGLPADRRAVHAHLLTEEGLAELTALLDSGEYALDLPEQGAMLTVAWLLRAKDTDAALRILAAIEPFTDRLCFTPRPAPRQDTPAGTVFRDTVDDVRRPLGERAGRTGTRARAQQEALAVWNPFADRVLAHWLETVADGRVDTRRPGGWTGRGRTLLEEYARLAAEHTLCAKHRKPKENLAILLTALREAVEGSGPSPRGRGLLQHAVDSMIRKRGLPGSDRHTALRREQAEHAARPTHDVLSRVLLDRLAPLPSGSGITDTDAVLRPTTRAEGVPGTWPIPAPLRAIVLRASVGTPDELVERGVIPSAEVLASVIPALTAEAETAAVADPALSRLLRAHHRAFRNRRSLLLLNLQHQVREHELPWIRATDGHRRRGNARAAAVRDLLPRLGATLLTHFPGTLVPNPMVSALNGLARGVEGAPPFLEELAADIFMGRFSPKFPLVAALAAELTEGSPYARYYAIDGAEVLVAAEEERATTRRSSTPFADLCRRRAGNARSGVAGNGMVIEQAQILTTHNLAALVSVGARPRHGWAEAARRAYTVAEAGVARLPRVALPLGHVRNAAFAWRQCLFFLSLCPEKERWEVLGWMEERLDRVPRTARERLTPVLGGLRQVLEYGTLVEREPESARRFLGWSCGGHWMLGQRR
ncbi:transcriptional regulator [Nocardiopsis sp. FIRDI 009]|uniref:transcriptional regulator n=1 Tax=Nocardiopsis sp. FIRDI 009 TaxID=714197 RepID=UPI000E247953|nr:transcriptional regulator [Nocardiopsis sp. FIRDI 009]